MASTLDPKELAELSEDELAQVRIEADEKIAEMRAVKKAVQDEIDLRRAAQPLSSGPGVHKVGG